MGKCPHPRLTSRDASLRNYLLISEALPEVNLVLEPDDTLLLVGSDGKTSDGGNGTGNSRN